AEDGIRDLIVTGVQTCALPICIASFSCGAHGQSDLETHGRRLYPHASRAKLEGWPARRLLARIEPGDLSSAATVARVRISEPAEIGRASCRERVELRGGARSVR